MKRTFAVIATKFRPDVLQKAVGSIRPQVDRIIIVTNGPSHLYRDVEIVKYVPETEPVNLSRMWNIGLDIAAEQAKTDGQEMWEVAIINDDATPHPSWVQHTVHTMRHMKAAAACTGDVSRPVIQLVPRAIPLNLRLTGWAFILAGELGVRADERLAWWFGDDDIDWQSRQLGGMVMCPGGHVPNAFPNGQMTPELHAQTSLDALAFKEKWGALPW